MRFMMLVKGTKASEAGVMPTPAQIAEMSAYNEELSKAGVLVDLAGLQPTSKGVKIRFSGGQQIRIDGPFTGMGDIVSGYWIINVKSPEEAIAWAMPTQLSAAMVRSSFAVSLSLKTSTVTLSRTSQRERDGSA
jgi:hypothetical protein